MLHDDNPDFEGPFKHGGDMWSCRDPLTGKTNHSRTRDGAIFWAGYWRAVGLIGKIDFASVLSEKLHEIRGGK